MTPVAGEMTQERVARADSSFFSAQILFVTDRSELVTRYREILDAENVDVSHVSSLADALYQLRAQSSVDMVVADEGATNLNALELSRQIKRNEATRFLPVMILLSTGDDAHRVEVLQGGADDFLVEPSLSGEFVQRCHHLIRNKRATDALEDSEDVIFTMARIVEGRDKYTQGHVERVAAYSAEIGTRMALRDADISALQKGGVVHDLGKVAVPDAILNKPGPLIDREWAVMRTHPVVGYDVLVRLRTFHDVLGIVRSHHERPNGKGYPDGLGGDDLPLLPRIAAVADCFDAVTTARPYHSPRSAQEAIRIIVEGSVVGDFDEEVAAVLADMVGESYLG